MVNCKTGICGDNHGAVKMIISFFTAPFLSDRKFCRFVRDRTSCKTQDTDMN